MESLVIPYFYFLIHPTCGYDLFFCTHINIKDLSAVKIRKSWFNVVLEIRIHFWGKNSHFNKSAIIQPHINSFIISQHCHQLFFIVFFNAYHFFGVSNQLFNVFIVFFKVIEQEFFIWNHESLTKWKNVANFLDLIIFQLNFTL